MDDIFQQWHELKSQLDQVTDPPDFREWDIWWCSVGKNFGYEIFGKDDEFSRPVVVIRKYNKKMFFGLPMTSKRRDFPSHYHYDLKGKSGSILLDQGKSFSSNRLLRHISHVHEREAVKIMAAFKGYFG